MALYNERLWRQTKDTEQLTFLAGEDLAYSTYVKESPIGSHTVIESTADDAIGYVLTPKGALEGEKVDIQILKGMGFRVGPGGTSSNFVYNEEPTGLINDSNTVFTLAQSPSGDSLQLYLNGQFLTEGEDYNLAGDTITFVSAPQTGGILRAFYVYV